MLWQPLVVLLCLGFIVAVPSYQVFDNNYDHSATYNSYSLNNLILTVTQTETCTNQGGIIGSLNTGTQVWSVSSVWLELTGGSYYIKGCLSGCKSKSNCSTIVSSPALDTLTTSCNSAPCGPTGCYCTSYYINKRTKCFPSARLNFP